MENVTPSMRLKVKRDTFYLPDSNSSIYFRNNESSFRMEGQSIVQWIEMLLPMFNGAHSLEELTSGLPDPHKNRVIDIAKVLFQNGFVQDISQEKPHHLSESILKQYASQIEFLNHFGGSGAFRFQSYRQKKVLAIGSGPFLLSLVSSLLESGLCQFSILITEPSITNKHRLHEMIEHMSRYDYEVQVEEVIMGDSWTEALHPFEFIFYAEQDGTIENVRVMQTVCQKQKKVFLPVIFHQHIGLAGPIVYPDSDSCWESAWRSIHTSVFDKIRQTDFSLSTAEAMLVNVLVFEFFKVVTAVNIPKDYAKFYLLNGETLEGSWLSYKLHSLVTEKMNVKHIPESEYLLKPAEESNKWFIYFNQLTSLQVGIFHKWEEGELSQLPLAQCQVQVTNPISDGPAELLSPVICATVTHEEARREAGMAGIEAYASKLFTHLSSVETSTFKEIQTNDCIGIAAGESFLECVNRGLQKCLEQQFLHHNKQHGLIQVKLDTVIDEPCQFYLKSLQTLGDTPIVALGKAISGFPVVWVGIQEEWYGCVGLNITLALRNVLQYVIMKRQNHSSHSCFIKGIEARSLLVEDIVPLHIEIPAFQGMNSVEMFESSKQVLKRQHRQLVVYELEFDPFARDDVLKLAGVCLREEEFR